MNAADTTDLMYLIAEGKNGKDRNHRTGPTAFHEARTRGSRIQVGDPTSGKRTHFTDLRSLQPRLTWTLAVLGTLDKSYKYYNKLLQ